MDLAHAAVVATLADGGNGHGGPQRVQHRRVAAAAYGAYEEHAVPLSPRQRPQQIQAGRQLPCIMLSLAHSDHQMQTLLTQPLVVPRLTLHEFRDSLIS